jgi:peptidyl-prolyl cis-trans isomerase C
LRIDAAEPNAAGNDVNASEVKQRTVEVAVTVNGVDITERQVEARIRPELGRMAGRTAQLPTSIIEHLKKQLRQKVLKKMILERVLDEQVQLSGIVVTDEEVAEQIKKVASVQKPPLSVEDFKALIEARGNSFERWKQQIRTWMGYEKLIDNYLAGKIKFTEEDAKKYYSDNKSEFETPERVRASHILIKPDTSAPDADPNQAKAKASKLLQQVKAGADFAELARANSDCPSRADGGDLGLRARGTWAGPFEKAAFGLKVGQVSDIVETELGYHIIKVTDRKSASVTTFEQAKDDIIDTLALRKRRELTVGYVKGLEAKAKVVYPPGKEPAPDRSGSSVVIPPGFAPR